MGWLNHEKEFENCLATLSSSVDLDQLITTLQVTNKRIK